ncbi:MAG: hypothetical protein ACO1TE_15585 [Prosthecobacter sp.]
MPATKLVCPHCEKTVEIQVSAVTRSRPCPECGEMVMLQMAEKSTKTKRRALLMGQAEAPEPAEPEPPKPSHEPQPLPGDAFERMRMDPEIKEFRRKLLLGAGTAGALVVVLVAVSWFQSYREEKVRRELFGAESAKAEAAAKAPAPPPPTSMIVPEDLPPPVTSGNLVFRPAGGDMTTAAQTPAIPTENLARLAAGEDMVRQFLAAPNWRQRALTVRDQLRVAPLMSIYYSKNSDEPVRFDSLVEPTEVPPRFSEHTVVFEGGGRRTATVEHTSNGARVDWESFVGAGEMAWSNFLEARPNAPTLFRVLVSPAGHYENSFGDPEAIKCYSLRSITEPGAKVVYGYMDKQNPQVKEIDYWLERSNEAVPMILRLRFPPDAPVDFQVWIQQFVQPGWVQK